MASVLGKPRLFSATRERRVNSDMAHLRLLSSPHETPQTYVLLLLCPTGMSTLSMGQFLEGDHERHDRYSEGWRTEIFLFSLLVDFTPYATT
jgi:hypothetical protein